MRHVLGAEQQYNSTTWTGQLHLKLIQLDRWPASQKTTSAPDAFPSRLFDKRSNVQVLTASQA